MRAIVARQREDGTFSNVGMNDAYLTSNYKTKGNLIKFNIPNHFKTGRLVRFEIYTGSIYKDKPDETIYIQTNKGDKL